MELGTKIMALEGGQLFFLIPKLNGGKVESP